MKISKGYFISLQSTKDRQYNDKKGKGRKKRLKIPKGQSESVYRRRTDNAMAKRKSTNGQTTINKTYI
jgi:hypothetical protein